MNTTLNLRTTHGTLHARFPDCWLVRSFNLREFLSIRGLVRTESLLATGPKEPQSPLREGLTPDSLALFTEFALDACNWSGTPLVGGNVWMDQARNGNLTDLKKNGLVRTFTVDGPAIWLEFTPHGVAYAKFLGLNTRAIDYLLNQRQ